MRELVQEIPPVINLKEIKKKRIHLAIFGHGNVGAKLIDQILEKTTSLSERRNTELVIFAIGNSKTLLTDRSGIGQDWEARKSNEGRTYEVAEVIAFANAHQLENRIAIDNTASEELVDDYEALIKSGFDLVSSNKKANVRPLSWYQSLRGHLEAHQRTYLYETNVGAGLPLVDTIKLLHQSGENITRIRGVFSGSLSYVFNTYSKEDLPFSKVLKKAIRQGLTEPDPREDLCGDDVGRKLLILARELELYAAIEDVQIHNLIPEPLRSVSESEFFDRIGELDVPYFIRKKNLKNGQVLRYVADLHGDLSDEHGGILEVGLRAVPEQSMLGQLSGSDSLFELFTESYGDRPIVIQGAGAGAQVTARGVFGDVLRIANRIN